jgi:hypothetical protein
MIKEAKPEATPDKSDERETEQELSSRRDFLRKLGKWSAVLIGAVAGGNLLDVPESAAWVNGGRAWVNARGGYGGGSWVNRAGGYGGGGWVNRAGGGGGAAWVNRAGGGGGAWVNRRGW